MLWALMVLFTVLWVLGMLGVLNVGMWAWLFCAGAIICLAGQFSRSN